ncbi:hypothetical protein [Pantoea sp. PSNIH1]|jgi:hypothetical protein|uniref:hypothetical protein n=1 Tax=Pantoea sp. PSNIH1 TaxID=1484158 RepID=UPI00119D3483|nr:hypothetical protein [Pantoea sp. PSNIH1]
MAIISTQNKNKSNRNYCRSILLAALASTAFAGTPAVAQNDMAAFQYQKVSSYYQAIWTNPITHNRVYMDSSWNITTKYENGNPVSTFNDPTISGGLSVVIGQSQEDLKSNAEYLLNTNGNGEYHFTHSEFFNYKNELTWFASGYLISKPDHGFILYLRKSGSSLYNVLGIYTLDKETNDKVGHLSSKLVDSFSR